MEQTTMHEILWELNHVTKEFAAVKALDDVSIRFRAGEIHALLGENGSGKSTMIKCIAGVHQPESGEIRYHGSRVEGSSPIVARRLGVETIFQEFSLVPMLSVCENNFLGRLPRKGACSKGAADWERMRKEASRILGKLGIEIDPMAVVGTLSMARQQLIMDEPTAALGRAEIVRAIFGADKLQAGRVERHGREIRVRWPQDAIRNGIALLSENRKRDGLFMNFYSGPNITIVNLKKILRHHFLNLKRERAVGEEYIEKLQISAAALDKSVQFLSGGNQQKVVIARWLHSGAELIILDEPTQGIDISCGAAVAMLTMTFAGMCKFWGLSV